MINFNKDSHIHTFFSNDADPSATFERYIVQAQALGLTELTFTDHVDFDAKHPLFYDMIDYERYIKEFNKVKQSSPIKINLGVEIGYQSHTVKETNQFLKKYNFDFVILSIHYIEQKDLYTKEYFLNKTKEEAYQIYFETCLEAINNTDNFNVFGHLDYISRYSPFDDYEYDLYKDIIDNILNALINKNKGIEINTSGYFNEGRCYPKIEVINRFIELGGTIITIGSDSHKVEQLGRNFNVIKDIFI
jgi:histidinol-phosphatase (PHP family)